MQKGVIDIGSNTIVLNIYECDKSIPKVVFHKSSATHLVGYIENKVMGKDGIEKACLVLKEYVSILQEKNIHEYKAFITEPARNIENKEEMLNAFRNCGLEVIALTGKEEAEYDYLGSKCIDTAEIKSGNAFDIGGGSTEFISFKEDEVLEAISIPVGCVRLSKEPVLPSITDKYMSDTFSQYPKLQEIHSDTIIGIGGTARATLKLYQHVYKTSSNIIEIEKLIPIYEGLMKQDEDMVNQMKASVDKGRQPVYLSGLNMLMSIVKAYNVKRVFISAGCVREGFLLKAFQ